MTKTLNLPSLCCLLVFLGCAGISVSARAERDMTSFSQNGNPLFKFVIHDIGERYWIDPFQDFISTSTLQQEHLGALSHAADYWSSLLGPSPRNASPVIVNVGTYRDDNASAFTTFAQDNMTLLGSAIVKGFSSQADVDRPLARIRMGTLGSYAEPLTILPGNGVNKHLPSVLLHELGHAMGIASNRRFDSTLTHWDRHLVDSYGIHAKPGMEIVEIITDCIPLEDCSEEDAGWACPEGNVQSSENFSIKSDGHAYFQGPETLKLIGDAPLSGHSIPGIPINRFEGVFPRVPELSHIELRNSMMSHQLYRNWTVFMEAELAMLQDIGIPVDRKNFYGTSIYTDNGVHRVSSSFSARNAEGTAYLPGVFNTTPLTVGLHIYGCNNDVTMAGDVLSSGYGSAGIRVDGWGNTLAIAPESRIQANGAQATALMVAYGKDQNIIHRGALEAFGVGGVGARFDFGDNIVGNNIEYRGSYLRISPARLTNLLPLLSELNGPLVQSFDVSGAIRASGAAVYISPNAHVKTINLLQGAEIHGDIVSRWNPAQYSLSPAMTYQTDLTFGRAMDNDGRAIAGSADPVFAMRYSGNITGPDSLRMTLAGGRLSFNGVADLLSAKVDAGTTLSGNALYRLSEGFSNQGTLAPGNSLGVMTIQGDFTNTGRLLMEFDAQGNTDRLNVSGAFTHSGTLHVSPVKDFYRGAMTLPPIAGMFSVGSGAIPALIDGFTAPASPTLSFRLSPGPSYTLTTTRAPDTYARYAANGNGARLGRALSGIGDAAEGDMQKLFTTLDFSPMDGSTIRNALPQLSPQAYQGVAQTALDAAQTVSGMMMQRLFSPNASRSLPQETASGLAAGDDTAERSAFVIPYGGQQRQKRRDDRLGHDSDDTGLLGGFQKRLDPESSAGLHVSMGQRRTKLDTLAGAHTNSTAFQIGVHGRSMLSRWEGAYRYGLARVGVERSEMRRKVAIDDYYRTARADWTGLSGALSAGIGKDWQINAATIGVMGGLDYTGYRLPSISERRGEAIRLKTEAQGFHSLRTMLGAQASISGQGEHGAIQASLALQWFHELLDSKPGLDARFAGYSAQKFTTRNPRERDALALQTRLEFDAGTGRKVAFHAGGEHRRKGYDDWNLGASMQWAF